MHGTTRFYLGDFVAAHALLERSMDYADASRRSLGGVNPYAGTLTFLALALAILGYIEQARSRMDQALSEARRRGHVLTLVYLLHFATMFAGLTRSHTVHAEELLARSTEQGFPHYLGWALALRGWSLVTVGRAQEGLALLKQGLAELRPIGFIVGMPSLLTWFAEAHACSGSMPRH
jgi:hypothetical protein